MPEPLDADGRFATYLGIVPFGGPALTDDPRPAGVPAPAGLTG